MKQRITTAGVICLLIFLLKFPEESLFAARDGMKLWLNTLIPTLLPFLILTGILLHTKGIEKFLSPLSFFWKKLLGLTPCGAYVFLLGILCGYPMGAKLTSDLYQKNKISQKEASYLLTFSNNPSPGFLTAYVSQICLGGKTKTKEITGILLLANIMCMLFFRFIIYKNKTFAPISPSKKETSAVSSPGTVIDVSIMNGFETITRLGGYILLFSILGAVVGHFCPAQTEGKYIFLGITELTTGLHQLALSSLSYGKKYLYAMAMTSFGGLCILAQTKSVLKGQLSILPYFTAKCIHAAFTVLLVLVISKVI